MTTYYVRSSGSDGAAGTSPATAWATITKAMATVAAADIVWIGGGVYRGAVTVSTSGTLGSEIEWRADIDSSQTGDSGLVVWTTWDDEVGSGSTGNGSVLDLNDREYNEFYDIVFVGSGNGTLDYVIKADNAAANYQGILFDTCTIGSSSDTLNEAIRIDFKAGAAISGTPITFQNCRIDGEVNILAGTFSADVACGPQIQNCVMGAGVTIDGPTSGSFGPTGFAITNCTFTRPTGTSIAVTDMWGTGTTGRIDNNIFMTNSNTPISIAGDGGSWNGDNNKSLIDTAFAGITGSNNNNFYGILLGSQVEHIYRKWFGWTPFSALEPVWDKAGSGYKSGVIDAGSATYAPATDMNGSPRPMARGDDVGAVEARARPEQESTTVNNGTYSAAFKGAGFYDAMRAVDAASITITVYCRKDANYTGTAPKLEVVNIPGVADQSDSLSVGAGNWEQLSTTFTPTSAGWVRVRLWSYDSSATGECYFDDLAVS